MNRTIRWYLKAGFAPALATSIKSYYTFSGYERDILIRPGFTIGYLVGLGTELPMGQKHKLYIEARMMPHVVTDRATHMADARSFQLMLSVPLFEH
ncbi:hypothetical protein GCM10028773_41270 [Spirosoma koreense]